MFITDAYAQTATGSAGGMGGLVQFAPLVLIVIVFYFLLIRPQQTQAKELKARQAGLSRGDKIVTAGGIIGIVKKVAAEDTNVDVEIAPNVTVSIVRSTITSVLTTTAKPDKP
jgi:preprotein translocase subunit YajC